MPPAYQSLYRLAISPPRNVNTLRAERGSLFLSGEVFAFPIFISVDGAVFHRENKTETMFEGARRAAC